VNATDVIDAGAGADKLLLSLVGSANIGAFSNFDSFDAVGLAKTLDVDILATKNTVTEFVTSGDVGVGAVLTNVGAGVGYRVTSDTNVANALTLTQKTAGDITLTMDIDESTDATTVATATDAAVSTNATGVKVVFDADFAGKAASATDNIARMEIEADAAKTLTVESGGDNATNQLFVDGTPAVLTTVTVTGAARLVLDSTGFVGAAKLATIDASAATGGLTASLATVINEGTIKLGSGADLITATVASTQAGIESISGFEKAAAAAVGTDATAKAAAIADADIINFGGTAIVADALTVGADSVSAKGIVTFGGAGPATLTAAIAIADALANAAGEVLVFEYLGNSYVFNQTGAAADIVVKLTGVTGITNIAEDTTVADNFFIV
jgi:hypothetical protein